jgi:hypothetical protein
MWKGQLAITAVVVEGRGKTRSPATKDVARTWVQ